MEATLNPRRIGDILDGFHYNELESKGVNGLSGHLVIQPKYQRNYIYAQNGRDIAVIDSLLRGYPLGLFYFNQPDAGVDHWEILDGQQRITSIGRFVTDRFAVEDQHGNEQKFTSLPEKTQQRLLDTELLIYDCHGSEEDITQWFKTINIAGVQLTPQELRNAVYAGPFVEAAKTRFSNKNSASQNKWRNFVKGDPARQGVLETALTWIADKHNQTIEGYMADHRGDADCGELATYFDTVLDWASSIFQLVDTSMQGRDWNRLYETYVQQGYSPTDMTDRAKHLLDDPQVTNEKGIYEYLLAGGETGPTELLRLLNVRVFTEAQKRTIYRKQTDAAKKAGVSNCSYCSAGHDAKATHIWALKDMDADHVTAWSKGGSTDLSNCELLCKPHNRAKGNR